MENSQPLATESFSYSWLTDRSPCPFDGNQSRNAQNFDFDVSFTGSPVSLVHADEIFSDGHIMPVYADGPKDVWEGLRASTSVPPSPAPPYTLGSSPFVSSKNQQLFFLDKWRKTSKRILQKCFGFVCQTLRASRPSIRVDDLDRKVCEVQSWSNSLQASPRKSAAHSAVDWFDIKKIGSKVDLHYGLKRVKSWSSLPQAAAAANTQPALPRLSPSNSCNALCDVDESSIHEAILYCKRSIEK